MLRSLKIVLWTGQRAPILQDSSGRFWPMRSGFGLHSVVIRKYYGRCIIALLLIPVVILSAAAIDYAIDPELARGHANYARNFALLQHLRFAVVVAALALVVALWLLACLWLLRAKSQRRAWLALALLGPFGFAGLMALPDRSMLAPADAYRRQLMRLPNLLRVLYEIVRFAVFAFVAMQLIEWFDDGTALLEASRRGIPLSQVHAEREASGGMWAFGDMIRAACVFVLLYALLPAGCNAVAWLVRRIRRN
jgi:hypothetical protein